MTEVPDDLEYRIAKLDLAPGDVLVVKFDRAISDNTVRRVAQYVRSAIGSDRKVLVIDSQVDLSVITHEEILRRLDGSKAKKPKKGRYRPRCR